MSQRQRKAVARRTIIQGRQARAAAQLRAQQQKAYFRKHHQTRHVVHHHRQSFAAAIRKISAPGPGLGIINICNPPNLLFGNELLPVCGPVAVANHLLLATGCRVSADQVIGLYAAAGGGQDGVMFPDLLDALTHHGLAGIRPALVEPDPLGGLLEVDLGDDAHAVAVAPGGWATWGTVTEPFAPITGRWRIDW